MGREQEILEYLFDQLTMVLSSHEQTHSAIEREVEALSTWDHCDPRLTDHVDCDPDNAEEYLGCGADIAQWPDDDAVGEVVCEVIRNWIDRETTDHMLGGMIESILDLGNSRMVRMLGDLYTPNDARLLRDRVNKWNALRKEAEAHNAGNHV